MTAPDIAIVVPTFNEAENVPVLIARLRAVMEGHDYEIIFVDDSSPDGTSDAVRRFARSDARIRVLERVGRRGLSAAVIEGLMATAAPYGVVIDGDLQHDETLLPLMIETLRQDADVAIASRYLDGGGIGDWSQARLRTSLVATWLGQLLLKNQINDPMSGFFAVRTDVFRQRAGQLIGTGYKILVDLLSTSGPPLKTRELAYVFQSRQHGESKLDSKVALEFVELLIARFFGRYVPAKFVMFAAVGGFGVGVHFAVLSLLLNWLSFAEAQGVATLIAMMVNFFINNAFTYHDRRLRGWRLLPGLLSFCAASSLGLLANVGVAVYLFAGVGTAWYLSALAGILVGATWNYVITSLYTWRS
ncbi:MAG: glycosyltransferase family 2 protein [Phyllobacteriaceae bacterium]|nr:glycosyltransferase family 2 protein [Phyllobacteriaceae bacterium]